MRIASCLLALVSIFPGCGKGNGWFSRRSAPACSDCVALNRPAPEIDGQDVNGVPFKLSDYRGKVVVLDFWGHW
jgi:hypothetical protein